MFFVYVLYDRSLDKMYIGFTADLEQRLQEHRAGGVHTTVRMNNWILVYYEACLSENDARKRERQLKTGFGRGYLRKRLQESFTVGR